MLDKIRTFASYKIVRFFFAIFLIIPFGLFGIDYYFRAPIGGDTVATVGNLRVGQFDYDQALRQQQETYQAQFGRNFDASLMDNPEIRKSVLDRLINERLLGLGAEKAGVRVSDRRLAERIAAEPVFQEDGCARTTAMRSTARPSPTRRSCRARRSTDSSACRSRAGR
jgi:peptidyl-prolyl cis-trans isomerase D